MWYVRISWEWKKQRLEYVELGWEGKSLNRNLWKYSVFLFINPCMKGNDIIKENNVEKVCRQGPATCSESKGGDRKVFWAIVHTIHEICGRKVNCGTSEHYLLWAQRNWKGRLVPKCKKTILCLTNIHILPIEDKWEDGMCEATRPLWLSKTHMRKVRWLTEHTYECKVENSISMYNVMLGCVFM